MAHSVKTDSRVLTPWSDVSRIFNNAKSLRVRVNGRVYEGLCEIDIDEQGCVTVAFAGNGHGAEPKKRRASSDESVLR